MVWATVVFSALVFAGVLLVLLLVRTPHYQLRRENVVTLLEMVLDGRASENDWRVFVSVPLRHDPLLDELRRRCIDIEEREYLGRGGAQGRLFTRQGMEELRKLLQELRDTG